MFVFGLLLGRWSGGRVLVMVVADDICCLSCSLFFGSDCGWRRSRHSHWYGKGDSLSIASKGHCVGGVLGGEFMVSKCTYVVRMKKLHELQLRHAMTPNILLEQIPKEAGDVMIDSFTNVSWTIGRTGRK